MSFNIKALKEELEQTKKDLQQLREKEFQKQRLEPDKEDFMFIENATKVGFKEPNEEPANYEFQKKRNSLIFQSLSGARESILDNSYRLCSQFCRAREYHILSAQPSTHVDRSLIRWQSPRTADSLAKWDSSGHVGGRIFYSVPGDLRNLWQHDRGTLHGTLLASTAAGMN
ncbi:hypothetical protein V6N13_074867 [Hibiscus sabdariffa]